MSPMVHQVRIERREMRVCVGSRESLGVGRNSESGSRKTRVEGRESNTGENVLVFECIILHLK